MGFLKTVGKGLLYVLAFPAIVIGVSLYSVLGIFIFLFQCGKLIFLFFSGRNLSNELEEDIKVKAILEQKKSNGIEDSDLSLYPSDSEMYEDNGYKSPLIKDDKEEKENE